MWAIIRLISAPMAALCLSPVVVALPRRLGSLGRSGPLQLLRNSTHLCSRLNMSQYTTQSYAESEKIEVNGVRLHYERRGAGPHAVLCIPGALGTAISDFSPQLEHFGSENSMYTIVGYDPRGYGASRPPNRTFQTSPEIFHEVDAHDAHGLMKALGFSEFSILGWSDGGIAGVFLAANYPDSVKKLVVWGANAYVSTHDLELFEKTRDVGNWSRRMRQPLEATYGSDFQRLWSNWIDSMKTVYSSKKDANVCMEELVHVQCPTLILHGEKDPLCPQFHAECLQEHIPSSHLHLFPNGKHNIHLRFAQEFNTIVDQFLSE